MLRLSNITEYYLKQKVSQIPGPIKQEFLIKTLEDKASWKEQLLGFKSAGIFFPPKTISLPWNSEFFLGSRAEFFYLAKITSENPGSIVISIPIETQKKGFSDIIVGHFETILGKKHFIIKEFYEIKYTRFGEEGITIKLSNVESRGISAVEDKISKIYNYFPPENPSPKINLRILTENPLKVFPEYSGSKEHLNLKYENICELKSFWKKGIPGEGLVHRIVADNIIANSEKRGLITDLIGKKKICGPFLKSPFEYEYVGFFNIFTDFIYFINNFIEYNVFGFIFILFLFIKFKLK